MSRATVDYEWAFGDEVWTIHEDMPNARWVIRRGTYVEKCEMFGDKFHVVQGKNAEYHSYFPLMHPTFASAKAALLNWAQWKIEQAQAALEAIENLRRDEAE